MPTTDTTPRAMTAEEMRAAFLDRIHAMMHYWCTTDLNRPEFRAEVYRVGETLYRMRGLVHSLLVMFDGCSVGMPALNITPSPDPEDEAFCRREGVNWWPTDVVINDCQLHDLWGQRDQR